MAINNTVSKTSTSSLGGLLKPKPILTPKAESGFAMNQALPRTTAPVSTSPVKGLVAPGLPNTGVGGSSPQAQADAIRGKVSLLQGQLKDAQKAGYKDNQEIQYGNNGQVIDAKKAYPDQGIGQATGQSAYGNLTAQLSQFNPANTQAYQDSLKGYNKSVEDLSKFNQSAAQMKQDIYSDPVSARVMQGRDAAVQQANAEKQSALQGAVNQQQTALGYGLQASQQQQNALTGAAGLSAPQQYGITTTPFDPVSGQFGQMAGGGGSLQSAVQNVVQRLQSGTMTYADAQEALSGYGQAGTNALQQALPQGFNIAQSNTLSGQQGSVGVNYQLADNALKNVENLISQLAPSQQTNIPGVNAVTQGFSTLTGIGSEQTRAVTGAVNLLRNAYASLLASARGGTPTDYSSQALAEIPDRPTPNDIAAIRHNFETLGQTRRDILGNPGNATQSNANTNTNIYSW